MPTNDDLLSGLGYGPAAAATDALNTVAPLDPDAEAKNRQTGRAIGLPQQVVRSAPAEAQVQATRQQFQSPVLQDLLRNSPTASRWLARHDNAAVAHDDVPALTGLTSAILDLATRAAVRVSQPGYFAGAAHDLNLRNIVRAAKAGVAQSAEGIAGVVERNAELADKYNILEAVSPLGVGAALHPLLPGLTRYSRQRRQGWEAAAQATQGDAKSMFAQDVLSGVQSVPGSLTAAAVTLASDNPYYGAAILGEEQGGQSYGEARDAGLSPAGAALKSLIDEGFETGTEIAPEAAMLKYAHGVNPVGHALLDVLGKEVGGEQIATLGQDFNQWAMIDANKGKSFQQYVDEIAPHALSTLTATLTTMGTMAGPGAIYRALDRISGRTAAREASAQEAEAVANHLTEMGQLAAASKLRERDPASFHEFVQQAAEDGPVEAVYVDPAKLGEVLNQSEIKPEQRDQLQKSLADPVRQAVANGHDVRLPIEDFETYLAGTPAGNALIEHIKTDPNGMTLAEAKDFMKTRGEELQAEVAQALDHASQNEAHRQSEERVQQAIEEQLNLANRFTKEVNAANAHGMASFYSTMAARMGQTPEELFAKYPIKVRAEGQGELDQAALARYNQLSANNDNEAALPGALGSLAETLSDSRPTHALYQAGDVLTHNGEVGHVTSANDHSLTLALPSGDRIVPRTDSGLAVAPLEHWNPALRQADQPAGREGRPILSLAKPNFGLANRSETEQMRSEHELFQSDMRNGIFYSPLERAVENVSLKKADGKQWLATISKLPGVKKEELEWTGLPEWLASRDGAFTKDEVQAFVKAGGVQVDEVELSGDTVPDDEIYERADELRDRHVEALMRMFEPEVQEPEFDGEWRVGQITFDSQAEAQQFYEEAVASERDEAEERARGDADEIDFRGVAEEDLRDEGAGTKFENYTEDGGEDYRELLLTLPEGVGGNPSESFRESGHFGDHPVVAHLRFKTRQTTDGKSVMFVEEVQSDWHQQGRDKGYRGTDAEERERIVRERARADEAVEEAAGALVRKALELGLAPPEDMFGSSPYHAMKAENLLRAHRETVSGATRESISDLLTAKVEADRRYSEAFTAEHRNTGQVPDAPFKSSWPALAMKRAIRWAVDNGIEQIAWTTGDQQRERYNLATPLGDVRVKAVHGENGGEEFDVDLSGAQGDVVGSIAQRGLGKIRRYGVAVMTGEQIAEVFGKDLGGRMVTLANQAAAGREAAAQEHEAARQEHGRAHAAVTAQLEKGVNYNDIPDLVRAQNDAFKRVKALESRASAEVTLSGEDLKIGGEGMLGFYDRNLVNIVNKIIKPHGGEVKMLPVSDFARSRPTDGTARLDAARAAFDAFDNSHYIAHLTSSNDPLLEVVKRNWRLSLEQAREALAQDPSDMRASERIAAVEEALAEADDPAQVERIVAQRAALSQAVADAKAAADAEPKPGTNPGFEITPALRQAAEQGFSLFQTNRGSYSPALDIITLGKSANLSTFLHESGHFYLEMLDRLAADPAAPSQVKDDFDTALKWFGVKDAATWRGMSLEQKRASHEKWARGFEAYLFSGHAPSLRLQSLFQKFRGWLVAVYHKITALGVKPTPSVREVFDRMLATDEEIQIAQEARSMLPLFKDREASGLDEHGWREYQRQADAATAGAADDLEARSLRDLKWIANARGREIAKLKRQARAVRSATAAQVSREVMAEPVYRAMDLLKRGQLDGTKVDEPVKLSIEAVDALYPDEAERKAIKDKLGYGAYGMLGSENAADPAVIAEQFGFTSADHLVRALTSAEPRKDKIAGVTEQRLLEEHGDLTDEKAVEDAADKAIHSDARARVVATEMAALNHLAGKPKMLASAARSYASEIVARLKVRNLKPSLYEAAAARAGKNAMAKLGKGNRPAAAAEKRNQLINTYASKAAIQAKDEVEQALAYFKRLLRPAAAKSIDREYLDQIENLLGKTDLGNTTLRALDRRASLAAWMEKQREIGFDPIVPDDLLETLGQRSYKDMTVEELRGLRDAIKNIEHLGRLKNKLLTAHKDREFSRAVGTLTDSITQFAYKDVAEPMKRSKLDQVKAGVFDFLADLRKLSSLAFELDGFKEGGAVWEYLIRPMNAAADREATMRSQASTKLAEILAPLGKLKGGKTYIPTIGQSLDLEARLAVALNTGNAVNRERLLSGENWDDGQLAAVLSTLTTEHWQVVQHLWDHIGSYWPEIAAKEARVTGVVPERVEAEPIEVVTAGGQTLTLPGGYYPIRYNANRSARADGHESAEIARQMLRGAYTAATTRRGHTKARVESTGMQLRYDLGVVTQHVSEVIHDLTHHEMLIDATRLLRASSIDGAIRAHYGPETVRAFRKGVEAVAAGDTPAKDAMERAIDYLRQGGIAANLGFNLKIALLHPFNIVKAGQSIGYKWVAGATLRFIRDAATMNSTAKWISEQSPFMAQRTRTMFRELDEIRNKIADKSKARSAVDHALFYLIERGQLLADIPTWLAQYDKSVAGGEDHAQAVALADQAVLHVQGGGSMKDRPAVMRGHALKKLFTAYYSFTNANYNLFAESVNKTKAQGVSYTPQLAADTLVYVMFPALLHAALGAVLVGKLPDAEDALAALLNSFFALFPITRDFGPVITGTGKDAVPAGLPYEQLARLALDAHRGKADERAVRDANMAAGTLFHYPAGQVDRTARGLEAIAEGQTHNPGALIVGPPPKSPR